MREMGGAGAVILKMGSVLLLKYSKIYMLETWRTVLQNSFNDIWGGFADFVPNFVAALIIFLIGVVIADLIAKVVAQIISAIKLDSLLKGARIDELLKRGGFNLNSGAFLGGLVKWFVVIVFLVASLEALGLNQVNIFLQRVLLYLPDVIAAVLILLAAILIAEFLHRVVLGSAQAAGLSSASLIATATRWIIWIFAVFMALVQLGIAAPLIQTLFTGIVIALAIGFGLSFGLGGQDAAGKFIDKVRHDISDRS